MDKYIAAKVGIHGTKATVLESNSITVGLTGAVVQLIYDDDLWQGMRKKVTFRGPCKIDVLTDENEVQLPWEVTTAKNVPVCVGVTGVDAAEKVLIPTVWATIGTVLDSAAGHNPAPGEPVPPVWAQVVSMIGELEKLDTETRENLVAAINEVLSKAGTGGGNVDLSGYATEEWVKQYVKDSAQNGVGLSDTAKTLLITILRNGAYGTDQSANITALEAELASSGGSGGGEVEPDEPDTEKTLTSIFATYKGGSVLVGTPVSALTDIVVTAYYSDGTSEDVTDYTLSGTIAEGSNTITVSYGGKTTTVAVTGVAESYIEDYQQVEYIEFDGNSAISTEALGSNNCDMEAVVSFPETTSERAIMTLSSGKQGLAEVAYDATKAMFFYSGGYVTLSDAPFFYDTVIKVKAHYEYGVERTLTVETGENTYTASGNAPHQHSTQRFVVGSTTTDATKYTFVGKVYNASYYADGVLMCDLMPCYRKSDGVIGMYDKVSGNFYTNAGIGTFGKGSDVA